MIKENSFVLRQTKDSKYSCPLVSWEEVCTMVEDNLPNMRPGYRKGVVLVDLNPDYFLTSLTVLEEGAVLTGSYEARRKGETPRKSFVAKGQKTKAQEAFAVLYASTVLAEDGDNELPAKEGNWEIISINASPVRGEMPINPTTLMHNHFASDGGTSTGLTDSEFVKMLGEAFSFWKDKAIIEGE